MMIRRTRSSPLVRAILSVAAALSLMAAFGLHPEPAQTGTLARTAGFATRASLQAPAHECVACLNDSPVLAADGAALTPAADDDSTPAFRREASLPTRLACRSLSGRSPPAGLSS